MKRIYHQLQGLYTAGDVLCAIDCVRALPEYNHAFFINHDEHLDQRIYNILTDLEATIYLSTIT
jgi:hypothetical protein